MIRETLHVGLVGYGYVSRTFHAPLVTAVPGLEVAAVATRNAAAVGEDLPLARCVTDAQALFDDPGIDLVVVATPNDTHLPIARAALRAGKHVVVEKPFALDSADARELAALAQAQGRILTVFQNRRWDSDFLTLRAVLDSGVVGRPVQLDSHFDRFRPVVPDRWREHGPGSGIWYDLGPHLVDQALQLFGRPDSVSADLAELRDGAQSDDYAHVVLKYPRLRVNLHATTLAAVLAPRFTLHGTSGSFVIHGLDTQEAALKAGKFPGAAGWGDGAPNGEFVDADTARVVPRLPGDYRRFYSELRDAVLDGSPPPVSLADALDVMAVLDAGRLAQQTGRAEPLR